MKALRILLLLALLVAAFLLGRHSAGRLDEVVETHIDTTVYYRPLPGRTVDRTITVTVPKWLFAPAADTACHVLQYNKGDAVPSFDSIQVQITERTLEYRDSTYYARVVGPAVGPLAPRLDFIETYNTTTVRTQIVRERPAWDIGIEVGADLRDRWAGIYATRNFGRISLSAGAGYDPLRQEPRLELRGKVSIWQQKTTK